MLCVHAGPTASSARARVRGRFAWAEEHAMLKNKKGRKIPTGHGDAHVRQGVPKFFMIDVPIIVFIQESKNIQQFCTSK